MRAFFGSVAPLYGVGPASKTRYPRGTQKPGDPSVPVGPILVIVISRPEDYRQNNGRN